MASFRTGFKIFRDFSLKKGLGRIRSFSEDRKPGKWVPEDQWAVRQPGSSCPEPCDKPRKAPKPSKSWLSICKDPEKEKEPECDVRHNNCPPPPEPKETPWYSLDNLIPKKKPQEYPPPLSRCREEIRRRQLLGEEEVCENMQQRELALQTKPERSECIMPKSEPSPAPVVNIKTSLPKELDIALWCERPSTDTSRIPIPCQNDRLPYEEFRPRKAWKPPPFSLPIRGDPCYKSPHCSVDCIIFSEFKQVEVPKPLYTRYKSVELSDRNLMFCMTNVTCEDDEAAKCLQIRQSRPLPLPCNAPLDECEEPEEEYKKQDLLEKPILEVASCKPVRIKRATKFKFRPKLTKLIEKRVYKRPCPKHKPSDPSKPQKEEKPCVLTKSECESPKVITGTLTDEPQVLERSVDRMSSSPPLWMYQCCKPGSEQTPLVPCGDGIAKEPDCCAETDGLKFYDGKDESICPKPSPDPWAALEETEERESTSPFSSEPTPCVEDTSPAQCRSRFVLMPEKYNIKFTRTIGPAAAANFSGETSFEKFVQKKTSVQRSFPHMKENILYDLQRLCPNPPINPSVFNAPCRKPPEPDCSRSNFSRRFSTLCPARGKPLTLELNKVPRRSECDDTSGKCKPRKLIPKAKECPKEPPKHPSCAELKLPCCPPVRNPPTCQVKDIKQICKKIPPPKPSFSECARDLPPCPKMTECDCWDRKSGKNGKK